MTEGYSFLQCLFNKYTETEYLTEAWIPINEILKQFLQNSIENFKPTSYQAIYCKVYKSTCKGYKERLYNDLKNLITEHCYNLKIQLDENIKKIIDNCSNTHMNIFILQFIDFLHQYHRAIQVIVPLFHYLDVSYVRPKMRSTIEHELLFLYKTIIIEYYINHVFAVLQRLINTSDSPSMERIDLLLHLMHDITPESAVKQRDLYRRYCNGEDVLNEIMFNEEDMITSASRTASKRSVDDLPGEEDQPSAKRTMNMIKSPHTDN
ncbi:unnamed protein product [Rotaria sordida]|uniref:Cullin N-terminal domain-containing protein n=1 Tax=Rotaria sordida TaxID=392033 RepID=A0A815DE30_9BILA|nr:unnamed protein product [Rotaria sordida]CAF1161131.1 unnamed protein product [Rotaria sordida]CAF1168764.1 unnamed protein product [Rotaria sordida]CAF1178812.1 unnamed protein product [Rotaria sordida]CAF1296825.1 unnamed protein product [Rotaria sordida]